MASTVSRGSYAILLATVLALLSIAARRYHQSSTHCYAGIPILDSPIRDSDYSFNCFTVSRAGIFSHIFSSERPKQTNRGYAIPGLWDGHGHLLQYGEFLSGVDLFGAKSLADVRGRIRDYVKTRPDVGTLHEWIRGVGWDQSAFGGQMPTASDLAVEPELNGKYIMLDRVDVHCIWVSQAVLDLLPNPLPQSPEGGEIINDPGPGVFCDNAMELVLRYWPRPTKDKKKNFVKTAMKALHEVGLVGMHDAGVVPDDIRLYEEMAGTRDWTMRVYAMRECKKRNTFCPQDALKIERSDGMLTVGSVKLFADGALGSWGSALLEPYSDHPWTSGSMLVNVSTLTSVATSWASQGFQVNIHAIGDRANRNAIDAIEAGLKSTCTHDTLFACQQLSRHRIEHAQIIHPDDQKRMHEIGIIPSIQPTHATSDMSYAEDRLGETRTSQEAYLMRSLLPLHPVLGSDFPVEPPNPFQGIYAAVARRSPQTGLDPHGGKGSWYPEETLTLRQALEGFTAGAARGAFLEDRAGVIREGAFADWIVLDEPLEQVDLEDLRTLKVRETWVGGKCVYRRKD